MQKKFVNKLLTVFLLITFPVINVFSQDLYELTDQYRFDFPRCISTGNLIEIDESSLLEPIGSTLGVFGFGGDLLQIDTIGNQVILTWVLLYINRRADSVSIIPISKIDSLCLNNNCVYKPITDLACISSPDGIFKLKYPVALAIDGIVFVDLKGRVEEWNGWFFEVCTE